MKPRIYLAGPITGLSWDEADGWRQNVIVRLPEFDCFSPLRAETGAKNATVMNWQDTAQSDPVLLTPRGILRRDYVDTSNASLIFANFIGAKKVSIGTVSELAWAFALRIPSIIVCPPDNIHHHPWMIEMVDWTVNTLDEGIRVARKVLLKGYE